MTETVSTSAESAAPSTHSTPANGTSSKTGTQQTLKTVLIGTGIVLALVGITAALYHQKENRQAEAREALYQADKALNQEVSALEKDKKTGDANALFPTAIQSYKNVIQKFSGTRGAFEAQLRLGDLYMDKGPVDEAIRAYESAVSQAPKKWDRLLALYSLGYAYEARRDFAKAIESFKKALDLDEGMKGELMMALARNQAASGAVDSAKSTYDQIMAQLSQTPYAKEAEIRKARLDQ